MLGRWGRGPFSLHCPQSLSPEHRRQEGGAPGCIAGNPLSLVHESVEGFSGRVLPWSPPLISGWSGGWGPLPSPLSTCARLEPEPSSSSSGHRGPPKQHRVGWGQCRKYRRGSLPSPPESLGNILLLWIVLGSQIGAGFWPSGWKLLSQSGSPHPPVCLTHLICEMGLKHSHTVSRL